MGTTPVQSICVHGKYIKRMYIQCWYRFMSRKPISKYSYGWKHIKHLWLECSHRNTNKSLFRLVFCHIALWWIYNAQIRLYQWDFIYLLLFFASVHGFMHEISDFLLYNNLFIYQVLCTLISRIRSLYSFLWVGAMTTILSFPLENQNQACLSFLWGFEHIVETCKQKLINTLTCWHCCE